MEEFQRSLFGERGVCERFIALEREVPVLESQR